MSALREVFREFARYPSAVTGLIIIGALVVLALYTVIAIPYSEGIHLWRGGEAVWIESPRNARPKWVNLFSRARLPETLVVSSETKAARRVQSLPGGLRTFWISLPFDYPYDAFPSEINLFFKAKFKEQRPYVSLYWLTPDGRRIALGDRTVRAAAERYSVSLDRSLAQKLGRLPPEIGLFAPPGAAAESAAPIRGRYELRIEGLLFEKASTLDAKLVVYGQVFGLAGTDHRRRDIMVALLWGTPVALAFGFLAALGSTMTTLVIAATGVWFGRWVDAVIQRITEVNAILPVLPILMMIGIFYSRSLWVMLGAIIALSVFSLGIKTYRSILLQVKESPYIEAARTYGTGHFRIVFRYMIPRVVPVLVPQFVTLIPSFVFLEAGLAVLGLGDPVLPTWGKVVNDAYANGALYKGYYYWVLAPSVLLMLTGSGFALVGFALDRIFNPRLRTL
ncbi:MAG TPA: ABC transporter permease [candidate division Zixibacteria bacterium]|nr:ABC transporter permease [candidate division Zixibacteria bacterium]